MIIHDTANNKIDVELNKDGYLHLTAFVLKGGLWENKTIGISPVIQKHAKEMDSIGNIG